MFDTIANNISNLFESLSKKNNINKYVLKQTTKNIKKILLNSDVSYDTVEEIIKYLEDNLLHQKTFDGIKPSEYIYNKLYEKILEIIKLEDKVQIIGNIDKPFKIMLVGLQGAGKTTTCAKLANILKESNSTPLVVAADTSRPAAKKQLSILSKKNNIDFFTIEDEDKSYKICQSALQKSKDKLNDVIIFDTAGRLEVNDSLMNELNYLQNIILPDLVIYIIEIMSGQNTINIINKFQESININSVIVTKCDSKSKAGLILSILNNLKLPIKYICDGEDISNISKFYAKRFTNRILGQGDLEALTEKFNKIVAQKEQEKIAQKLKKREFNLDDYKNQLELLKKAGSVSSLIKHLPKKTLNMLPNNSSDMNNMNKELNKKIAVINSMTKKERINPNILNISRLNRISNGSGVNSNEVKKAIKELNKLKKLGKYMV